MGGALLQVPPGAWCQGWKGRTQSLPTFRDLSLCTCLTSPPVFMSLLNHHSQAQSPEGFVLAPHKAAPGLY